jgi:hypothetical protein
MQTFSDDKSTRESAVREFLPVVAGAAVGIAGVGAVLALVNLDWPLRAPFTVFYLLVAPAFAVGSALRGVDPLSRPVLAAAVAAALDVLVAEAMLALHVWSVRDVVLTVGCLSLLLLLPGQGARVLRRRRAAGGGGAGGRMEGAVRRAARDTPESQGRGADVDRPLPAGHRGVQVATNRRQRDVDDEDVHHHDDHAGAADREHQEAAASAELADRGGRN